MSALRWDLNLKMYQLQKIIRYNNKNVGNLLNYSIYNIFEDKHSLSAHRQLFPLAVVASWPTNGKISRCFSLSGLVHVTIKTNSHRPSLLGLVHITINTDFHCPSPSGLVHTYISTDGPFSLLSGVFHTNIIMKSRWLYSQDWFTQQTEWIVAGFLNFQWFEKKLLIVLLGWLYSMLFFKCYVWKLVTQK